MVTKKEQMKPWLTKMPLKEGNIPGYQLKSKRTQYKLQSDPKEVHIQP
jgi:hypothetical protein